MNQSSTSDCREPQGQALVNRYRKNYGIPDEAELSEAMILSHWDLERRLRGELLASSLENRRNTFERCYTELYSELGWLNRLMDSIGSKPPESRFADWLGIIGEPGDPPARVFELGPGKGELIGLLADRGFDCTASEITSERGDKWQAERPNLGWIASDGIHLDLFVAPESFDIIISSQVIEHLHPDDLDAHFRGAASILRPGGRYIMSVPHSYAGPADISRVFDCDSTHGMHLKEYTYRQLTQAAEMADFHRLLAPIRFPGGKLKPVASSFYLNYMIGLESLIGLFPAGRKRRMVAKAARVLYFSPFLMLVAEK